MKDAKKRYPYVINLCAGGGCCPDAEFLPDGSVVLTEHGQNIKLSAASLQKLIDEVQRRGKP